MVSLGLQRRGQRITVPVRKLFSKEKRPYGLGMVGRLTNRTYRKRIDSFVKQQIEDMDDHRWVEAWVPGRVSNRLWPDCPIILHSSQAILHLLGHLCAFTHHHPGRLHLRDCSCGVFAARDSGLGEQ